MTTKSWRRCLQSVALLAAAGTWACESATPTAPVKPAPQHPAFDVTLPSGAPLGDGKLYVCKYGTDATFHISVKNSSGVVVKTFTPTVLNGQCNLIDFQLHQFPLFVATITEDPMPNVHVDIIRKDTIVGQAVTTQMISGTSTVVTSYGLEVGSTLEFYNTVLTPDVSISKTADQGTVNAGDNIGFTVTVNNNGSGTASNVTVLDTLPTTSGVSWSVDAANSDAGCSIAANVLSCNFGNVAAGGSKKVHVTSPTTAASCAVLNNRAILNNDLTKTASATVSVLCPSFTIEKTADNATVDAGSQIGFTVTVKNSGVGSASNVSVTDPLPTGSGISWSVEAANSDPTCSINSNNLSCNFGTLASGVSKKVHVTSPTTVASCGKYDNTATLVLDQPKTASASTTVQCPSLQITKTADAASVNAGSNIGFTITLKSNGPGTATSVVLTDALPTGTGISWSIDPAVSGCSISSNTLTCNFGDLASGVTKTVHLSSPTTTSSCGSYPNTAKASATNHAEVQASATTSVVNCITFSDETATGAGFPWKATQGAPNNWFMYTPWVTTSGFRGISAAASGSTPAGTDLIAGQIYIAGRITGTRGGGANSTSITITLNSGFRFQANSDNVKINPMSCTAAQPYVQPGQFSVKRTASQAANSITVTGLPNTACYGIHVGVQRQN